MVVIKLEITQDTLCVVAGIAKMWTGLENGKENKMENRNRKSKSYIKPLLIE